MVLKRLRQRQSSMDICCGNHLSYTRLHQLLSNLLTPLIVARINSPKSLNLKPFNSLFVSLRYEVRGASGESTSGLSTRHTCFPTACQVHIIAFFKGAYLSTAHTMDCCLVSGSGISVVMMPFIFVHKQLLSYYFSHFRQATLGPSVRFPFNMQMFSSSVSSCYCDAVSQCNTPHSLASVML